MKLLVTYKSKTGFSKRYAEMIAEETGCEALAFDEMTVDKMSEFDIVVFGGGLYAGGVNGLAKARSMFEKSNAKEFIIFATGGTPNAAKEAIDEVWMRNLNMEELEAIPHYYMQAGICYEKMSFADKALMKMVASMLSKKADKTDFEEGFALAIKESYDISDRKYAEPLIRYLVER